MDPEEDTSKWRLPHGVRPETKHPLFVYGGPFGSLPSSSPLAVPSFGCLGVLVGSLQLLFDIMESLHSPLFWGAVVRWSSCPLEENGPTISRPTT